jgi:magnesium transporter
MRSALHNPVPSPTLLKFLKSQSEGICLFNLNPRAGSLFDHAAPAGPKLRSRILKAVSRRTEGCLSATVPRRATIKAGFLNLSFLWPRSATSALRPKSSRNIARVKGPVYENPTLVTYRNSSTQSSKWLEKLWGSKGTKGGRPLQPDDLPGPLHSVVEDGSDSIFSKGRIISAKAAAQPKLRCTELDENGNVVLASGEFKKSELIARVRLPLHTLSLIPMLIHLF